MADLSKLPKDYYVTSMQFTENAQQEAYAAIDPTLPEHSLAGKVAVITGASRGIGKLVGSDLIGYPFGKLTYSSDLLTDTNK